MNRRDLLILGAGTAVAWPIIARAQQKAMQVIGYLSVGSPNARYSPAFHQGLSETGYVEGQNVAIEYRWAEDRYDRLPALAGDLVGRNVGAIVTSGGPLSALAAKNATSTIPIVFIVGGDPVAAGLVASVARPGGNLTGFTIQINELMPKRLELLSELVPQATAIALLVNPNNAASAEGMTQDTLEAAGAKGLAFHVVKAGTESEIDAVFATLVQLHAGALLVSADQFFDSRREQLVALAARHAVPAIYTRNDYVTAGGLISYGPTLTDLNRQVGTYVGKILNGAKPRRSSGPAADDIRAAHQSEDRQGTRADGAGIAAGPCRRGHRVRRRDVFALLGAATAFPAAGRAQRRTDQALRIGYLGAGTAVPILQDAFRRGLRENYNDAVYPPR